MPTAKAEKVLLTNLLKHSSLALFTATCIEHGFFHYGGVLKLSPRTFTACQLPHQSPENNAVTCLCCYSYCINHPSINLYTLSLCSPPQWSYYCHSPLSRHRVDTYTLAPLQWNFIHQFYVTLHMLNTITAGQDTLVSNLNVISGFLGFFSMSFAVQLLTVYISKDLIQA